MEDSVIEKDAILEEITEKEHWEDEELYKYLRKIIDEKCKCETIDDRFERLVKSIPDIIRCFKDCSSEELYRTLAKKQDGTLATIQLYDKKRGIKVYKTIELNPRDYKKFYYQTLSYCLIMYIIFYNGIEYKIESNIIKRKGTLKITQETLPHLLGLEPKYVSSKNCYLLESIIPGYNSLSILDKIFELIINNEKIIQFEEENGYDIFNYYKNMQKNKSFLLLGRFFSNNESGMDNKNRVVLLEQSDNQLCLYKKSNMNDSMNRNLCKMIIQKLESGDYFPRSLQTLSGSILESLTIMDSLEESDETVYLELDAPECEEGTLSYLFMPLTNAGPEDYEDVEKLISIMGVNEKVAKNYIAKYKIKVMKKLIILHMMYELYEFIEEKKETLNNKRNKLKSEKENKDEQNLSLRLK